MSCAPVTFSRLPRTVGSGDPVGTATRSTVRMRPLRVSNCRSSIVPRVTDEKMKSGSDGALGASTKLIGSRASAVKFTCAVDGVPPGGATHATLVVLDDPAAPAVLPLVPELLPVAPLVLPLEPLLLPPEATLPGNVHTSTAGPAVPLVVAPLVPPVVPPLVAPVVDPLVAPLVAPDVDPVVAPVVAPLVEPVLEPLVAPVVDPVVAPPPVVVVEPVLPPVPPLVPAVAPVVAPVDPPVPPPLPPPCP